MPPHYGVLPDVVAKGRLHILVGFHDHDTTMLGATANIGMYLGANGVSAGGNHYLANVIAGQQNVANPTYAAAN